MAGGHGPDGPKVSCMAICVAAVMEYIILLICTNRERFVIIKGIYFHERYLVYIRVQEGHTSYSGLTILITSKIVKC